MLNSLFGNSTLWVFLAFFLFCAAIVVFAKWRQPSFRVEPKPILTANEIEFFGRLREALPDFEVFPQVCMGAIIKPANGSGKDYARIRGTFAQKIIDFTVCDPKTLKVITLIELDDRTHDAAKDQRRDSITGSAGYPTLRWHSRKRPLPAEIRKAVLDVANNYAR